MQQRFRRDAADIETGAAERGAHLNTADFQSQLTGPNGGIIAARSAADDYNIICRHGHILSLPSGWSHGL